MFFESAASAAAGVVIDNEEHPDVDESEPSSKSASICADVVDGATAVTGDSLPIGPEKQVDSKLNRSPDITVTSEDSRNRLIGFFK